MSARENTSKSSLSVRDCTMSYRVSWPILSTGSVAYTFAFIPALAKAYGKAPCMQSYESIEVRMRTAKKKPSTHMAVF